MSPATDTPQAGYHPTTAYYVRVGIVLFILTIAEVAVIYIEALAPLLVPLLVILSVWKFLLVIMVFMHLRFDHRVYTGFFIAGMVLAVIITGGLVWMFSGRIPALL